MITKQGIKALGLLTPKAIGFYKNFGVRLESTMATASTAILPSPTWKSSVSNKSLFRMVPKDCWDFTDPKSFFKGPSPYRPLNVAVVFVNIGNSDKVKVEELQHWTTKLLDHYRVCTSATTQIVNGWQSVTVSNDEETGDYRERCQKAFNGIKKPALLEDFLFLFILPESDGNLNAEITRWADCEVGAPALRLLSPTLRKVDSNPKIMANTCLKIHFKLGRETHQIISGESVNEQDIGLKSGTMIMGADLITPGRAVENCPSIAAVVAYDHISNQYLGSARLQASGQRHISELIEMVQERVIAWFNQAVASNSSSRLPSNIIFYRNGMNVNRLDRVNILERGHILEGWRNALISLQKDPHNQITPHESNQIPKLAMLVFGKINPKNKDTLPFESYQHFRLQIDPPAPQAPMTSRNVKYSVIHNDTDLELEGLMTITNSLFRTGFRNIQPVKAICPPATYARGLCHRLKGYIRPVLAKESKYEFDSTATTPDYVSSRENDDRVWKVKNSDAGRKNPWHPRLDNSMFYL